ncbi:MAG: phospholipase A [Pseudomonadota bacterium]
MRRPAGIALLSLTSGLGSVRAASLAAWESCSAIVSDADRLACYDRVAGRAQPEAAQPASTGMPGPDAAAASPQASGPELLSALSRHWELDDPAKQGTFLFRPHRASYFLPLKYSNRPNNTPFSTLLDPSVPGLDSTEARLQLSFKVKALEGVFDRDTLDLWFGYTVTSHWQAYNDTISSPFRETNYEPEAMLVWRTDYRLAGFRGRFVNFGLVHQSNGRGENLSRSWNRAYAQLGFERGNLSLLVRPWYRIPENDHEDDNPDIGKYLGHGDLQLVYRDGRQTYSLLVRNNLRRDNNRGALDLSWRFPLHGRLSGYVQVFSGYGESLIDYDHIQQTFGFGISLAEGI